MKLVIITSNHLRHKYFVQKLSEAFNVAGVITEEKKRDPSKKGDGTDLAPKIKEYFRQRELSENIFFGGVNWEKTSESIENGIITIPTGQVNNIETISLLQKWNPDYLVVFGSSILGKDIIKLFEGRIINTHLGLSPFYRGSGTNFWPLYDEKPEYVGVTIHYLDEGIDTGKIIIQGRPDIDTGDSPHSIGNKTIVKGVEILTEVLRRIQNGEVIEGKEQDHSIGKLCLFSQCSPHHIIELQEKFDNGLIQNYLKRISQTK